MSGILIVGNSIKDVFLKLDERHNSVEKDRDGTPWINLGFNGSTYKYLKNTVITSGAAITEEIFTNFGIRSEIIDDKNHQDTRYILNLANDQVAYLNSADGHTTHWQEPTSEPEWIFIDRSAEMTESLMREILAYLTEHSRTRLAFYVSSDTKVMETRLLERAKIVFAENNDWVGGEHAIRVKIDQNSMTVGEKSIKWHTDRNDLMTHLTVSGIASATFLAALLRGESIDDALRMARKNVETASLSSSLSYTKMKQLLSLEQSEKSDLKLVAKMLMEQGKGILAADESGGSIHKKFETLGIPDDETHRRDYRNILLSLPHLEQYVSGVILFEETAGQLADNGQTFTEFLTARGIIPGIKVDKGLVNFDGSIETYTTGLDGLAERLAAYHAAGLRFAKWRAAFTVSTTTPSREAMEKNSEILATYARLCQEAGIVPIVEPEVVHDGNYSLRRCAKVTADVLDSLFRHLKEENVELSACILKVNMVLASHDYSIRSTAGEVGRETIKVLAAHVPADIAGVVFLSGGQSPEQATANLQAVTNYGPLAFPISFSFSRALGGPALEAWHGDNNNREAAESALLTRLQANCAALIKNN